ncbi:MULTISPECIES: PAS domain S-box protein [Trichocoleus]|uniref:histidine kinase n=1 Tax=Trichocoleus desertorum GB2-A4 TaxID=2933944 RepID=A0ABV0J8K2_9CYAN|nr:PAS domain S-box protein [Trichocoleus sp. FACHB-46]
MKAACPDHETERLQSLQQYQILDTESESTFDELTSLAARICSTPVALISLIDRDRQWFKSKVGLSISETPRDLAFCAHAILQNDILVVPNALSDVRFAQNLLVITEPYIRFYAGVPLTTPEGFNLGTLCIIDYVPREINVDQLEALRVLSHQVVAQLELRRQRLSLSQASQLPQASESLGLRTSEDIQTHIQTQLGFVPPFFGPAQTYPQVLENLWHQTQLAYLGNPLSPVFKEKLSAYLSRYCAIPYCMICHSCSLRPLGVEAQEVLALLEAPPPTELEVDDHLTLLSAHPEVLSALSEGDRAVETSLLYCSIFIFLNSEEAEFCRQELRRMLGLEMYQHLIAFIAYVKTCHMWMEAHPEVAYTNDARVLGHFQALLEEAPNLADFFEHYRERVQQEQQNWVKQQAAIVAHKQQEQALRQAAVENLRLARAIAAVTDGVLITDPHQVDNPIIYVNSAFSRMTGYEPEEVIGQNCRFLQGPETDLQEVAKIRQAIAAGKEAQTTLLNYRKDGQPFWSELRISPIFSELGELLYFVGVQTDVTPRKQAEEERRCFLAREQTARAEAEVARERMTNILESITDAFFAVDHEWRFTYINPHAERLLQKAQHQLLGQRLWDEFPEAVDSTFQQQYQLAMTRGVSVEFEGLCPALGAWFEVHAYPTQDGLSVYFQDITARKQAEHKLREQAAFLEVATDAIWVQDLNSEILVWNRGAETLYGWTAAEAIGQPANQFLAKETSLQLETAWQQTLAKGEWYGELHQATHDGPEVVVSSRWTLLRDEQSQPKSILVVNTDITQKKQIEAQFLRAQRMESIGTLAGGIAHDLNNVLAPILMSTQLLERKIKDEQSQRLLNTVELNAKRGADLVRQVLSFARGLEGERTLLQIRHLILEIAKIAKETFPKSIEIYTDIPQELWPVSGDATQLHQVLMNLCVNARDAMNEGGTLSITAENLLIDENYAQMHLDAQAGSYIVVTVSDTGAGIPPEILDRIFEPFFTTKDLGKGTGLGLSTVMGIIKSHGGFVHVSSKLNQETHFKVFLPATEATVPQPIAEASDLPWGRGEQILVVDDEAAIRDITKTSLEAFGYRVLVANDGIEAIALYAQHKDDLSAALVDMMMPSMDGPTTIRTLQKINPQLKTIAVSGLVTSDKLVAAAKAGVKTFLNKPFTAKELLQTLDQLLHT